MLRHGVARRFLVRSVHTSVDFKNIERSFSSKSNEELLRAYLVLTCCKFPTFVRHANTLTDLSYKFLGSQVTNFVLRQSFFRHFAGGENEIEVSDVLRKLKSGGVRCILNYSAEGEKAEGAPDESKFETNYAAFKRAIEKAEPESFIALKVTGLMDMDLLGRMATLLPSIGEDEMVMNAFEAAMQTGTLDRLLVDHLRLSSEESNQAIRAYKRMDDLAKLAKEQGVRVLVDAEQRSLQPVIELCKSLR